MKAALILAAASPLMMFGAIRAPHPVELHGPLAVKPGSRVISHADGTPLLWIGCTSWGMTEWMTRPEVEAYLDDRAAKGMTVVQLCLFWGKRSENPTRFTVNPANAYGHRALAIKDGTPDGAHPAVVPGGDPETPNDYWDHVDFCLGAIKRRGMFAAVLPFWGRRYVNATHRGHSQAVFTAANIDLYGEFLGRRYGAETHIIWVNGGDVAADQGGDFTGLYRQFAEGLVRGASDTKVGWNEHHPAWERLLMTYHPDGDPMRNSSRWFHDDAWLDFNMIETHVSRDAVAAAIRADLERLPLKPTVLGEGHYEGDSSGRVARAIHIRRQAYQSFFAGAAGHTYGAAFDAEGKGPLFSPYGNWQVLLGMEGAGQLGWLRRLLETHAWSNWTTAPDVFRADHGAGELEKMAVRDDTTVLVYFPENSPADLELPPAAQIEWFDPTTGAAISAPPQAENRHRPPPMWEDAVLIASPRAGR